MTAPRVLVTRPAGQAPELVAALEERGVRCVAVPTVAIDSSHAAGDLDAMLAGLADADWLVLTSPNGADALVARMRASGTGIPARTRVAAVGPATASVLDRAGIAVDHVPDAFRTVEIAAGLGRVEDRRVVLARADAATPDLPAALLARGARVEEVVAYRTVEGPAASAHALRAALAVHLDGITFTSSSTVRGLVRLATPADARRARALPAFCIGPVTAATARELRFGVAAVAGEHTAGGLAAFVAEHFARRQS